MKAIEKSGSFLWLTQQELETEMCLKRFLEEILYPIFDFSAERSFSSEIKRTLKKVHQDKHLKEVFSLKAEEIEDKSLPYEQRVACAQMVVKFISCCPKGSNISYKQFLHYMKNGVA